MLCESEGMSAYPFSNVMADYRRHLRRWPTIGGSSAGGHSLCRSTLRLIGIRLDVIAAEIERKGHR